MPSKRKLIATEQRIQSRLMEQHERPLIRGVRNFLDEQAKDISDMVKDSLLAGVSMDDIEENVNELIDGRSNKFRLIMEPHLLAASATFYGRVLSGANTVEKRQKFSINDLPKRVTNFVKNVIKTQVEKFVNASTKRRIAKILTPENIEGKTPEELAEEIFSKLGGKVSLKRARTIAQTAVHQVSQRSSQEAAQKSPLKLNKIWITRNDGNVRKAHDLLHGVDEDIDSDFTMVDANGNSFAAAYPGDERLPPALKINCRCILIYEPKRKA